MGGLGMLIKTLSVLAMIASVVSAGYAILSYTQSGGSHGLQQVVQGEVEAGSARDTRPNMPDAGKTSSQGTVYQNSTGSNSPNISSGRDINNFNFQSK
jgi:hypothetical protein